MRKTQARGASALLEENTDAPTSAIASGGVDTAESAEPEQAAEPEAPAEPGAWDRPPGGGSFTRLPSGKIIRREEA